MQLKLIWCCHNVSVTFYFCYIIFKSSKKNVSTMFLCYYNLTSTVMQYCKMLLVSIHPSIHSPIALQCQTQSMIDFPVSRGMKHSFISLVSLTISCIFTASKISTLGEVGCLNFTCLLSPERHLTQMSFWDCLLFFTTTYLGTFVVWPRQTTEAYN